MATATVDAAGATATDSDPVVARYNVFLKPQLPAHQKLLVLQYPNRVDKTSPLTSSGLSPTELRVKQASGMVEIDIPLDYNNAYDRTKGMAWGGALASSTKAKAGGSHGLAGGFGVGGVQGARGRALAGAGTAGGRSVSTTAAGGGDGHYGSLDWSEAIRQDRVLRLQTLGGMCPPTRTAEARWMIGVFDGGNLHLTPVNSLVHLRPQLHHIDAEADLDRQKHRDSAGADGGAGGRGAGGPAGGPVARAIHMTIKSAGADGDEVVTETMADRLRAVQMENWTRLTYVGDDDENSWDVYNQTLFLRETAAAASASASAAASSAASSTGATAGADDDDKEKSTDILSATDTADDKPLVAKVPSLRTAWQENDLLQAISGIQKPADDSSEAAAAAAEVARQTARLKAKNKAKAKQRLEGNAASSAEAVSSAAVKQELSVADGPAPIARRGRPSATLPPSRGRGGRTRQTGPGRGSAMDID
ncbi:sulfite reductase beta subunit [Grosmannia clavigera kw1407]|uniref:Sulfite reductase beta subunit n=1 Tax=Grosmannia clavigera (strain kw1407 / UAMH 11150) TaxID=655863 RepID=F0X847_GROCL|nr:sulfite reductase beta subunit [Grosmannia clavigera kw1407]EFX06083.1 sulfite reductase beta subunit [Grosmannia clavigera kw1407]